MSNKRTNRSAGRLRLQALESREVPDAGVPDVDPLPPDDTIPVQMPPPDAKPVDPADDPVLNGEIPDNPDDVIFQTTSTPDVPPVDLAASLTVDRLKPGVGDVVTFKLTVANAAEVQATGVAAAVTLPAGMTFVSSDAPNKFDPATGTWTPGTVPALGKAVLMVKARVTEATDQAVTAAVTGADQPDPTADNNSATVTVSPVLGKLKLASSFSGGKVNVGSTVVLTVTAGNTGAGRVRDVVVTNTLPAGLTFVKALSTTQGSYNAATHTWTVGTVAPGVTPVLRLVVVVGRAGQFEVGSSATGTGLDGTTSSLDVTGAITGVQSKNPGGWAYFGGPWFSTRPGPVPTAAASWHGAQITTQFLAARGFKMNGFRLA